MIVNVSLLLFRQTNRILIMHQINDFKTTEKYFITLFTLLLWVWEWYGKHICNLYIVIEKWKIQNSNFFVYLKMLSPK